MKITITILSFFCWFLLACGNPDQNRTNSKEIDNRDIPVDNNVDTIGIGNDTLGAGDGKGPDHF